MHDDRHTSNGRLDIGVIREVSLDVFNIRTRVKRGPVSETAKDGDPMTASREAIDNMRADEPVPAEHEDVSHGW